jgi:hypothetical protein
LALPGTLADSTVSWVKKVDAWQVATTLSFGPYWYVCLVLASDGFLVLAINSPEIFTIRSSLPTWSKKLSIDQVFDLIQSELRSQYNLGYVSDMPVRVSEFRTIQLAPKQKGFSVQARDRYWAKR